MEKIFSFIAEYSSVLGLIVTLLIGYWVSKLEPFKVRDKEHEKNIDKLESRINNLSDFVQEQLRDGETDCRGCRKEIDRVLGENGKSLMEIKGKIELFDEKLGGIQQAYYETQAIITTKKEIMTQIANFKLEVESFKKDLENLAHRIGLIEIE